MLNSANKNSFYMISSLINLANPAYPVPVVNILLIFSVCLFIVLSAKHMFLAEQKEIAQLTCECERHIGTQSGGMDQVIHFCFL